MSPKWYVELYVGETVLHLGEPFKRKEDQTLVAFLTTCLNDPLFTAVKIENYIFLTSSEFDALNDEEEVYRHAQSLLPILNGILKTKFGMYINSVKIGDVYFPREDGLLTRSSMRTTFVMRSHPTEDTLKAAESKTPSTLNMLLMARNNPLVAEALEYLSSTPSWGGLEKIFEIIRKDCGKKQNDGRLPKDTFDAWSKGRNFGKSGPGKSFDFLQSAHSYHWSGTRARHSSVESQRLTGVNPMDLNEATQYIVDLLTQWLSSNP